MNANFFKSLTVACVMLFSSVAIATDGTIGKYNLILLGDYNFEGGDVQGQAFIGGNLNASSPAEFGSRLPNTDTAIDAVTVVGNVNANIVRVLQDNNLVYGGSLGSTTVELNGGDDGQLIHNPGLSVTAIENELYADSAFFRGLSSTGTLTGGALVNTDGASQAVFNVNAADIFAQNNNLTLDWNGADTVIINVAGTSINIDGGVNLNSGFTEEAGWGNIVWNFFEATTINFANLAMKGSVLAPHAVTTGGASFDGAFAAVSYTGAREFHNFVFNYNTPPTQVPEPSVFLVMLLALLWMARNSKFSTSR